jgi:hypothetical protein
MTPHDNSLETTPNQEVGSALEKRVYRTLARCYILEQRKQETRKRRATSVSVALLSAIFFVALIAFVYWGARKSLFDLPDPTVPPHAQRG